MGLEKCIHGYIDVGFEFMFDVSNKLLAWETSL